MNPEKIYLRAPLQELAPEEVKTLLGGERYQAIRARDPHPCFIVLSAAHEGESRGKILGGRVGANPGAPAESRKHWRAERIRELVRHLTQAPVYLFHNRDNSPRPPVGEIVAAALRRLQGRLHALAVAYIADPGVRRRIRAGELDTCSIEAELEFSRREKTEPWVVSAVRRVTGLALGSRQWAEPGFPGAGLLAVVQEFEPVDPRAEGQKNSPRNRGRRGEGRLRRLERELAEIKQQLDAARISEQAAKIAADQVRRELAVEWSQREGSRHSFPVPPEADRDQSAPWQKNPLIPREN